MILKTLMQILLNTRTTKEEAGQATLPSDVVDSTLTKSGLGQAFVSPVDGWAFISARASDVAIDDPATICGMNEVAGGTANLRLLFPVVKGRNYTCGASGGSATVKFVSILGGVVSFLLSHGKEVAYVY